MSYADLVGGIRKDVNLKSGCATARHLRCPHTVDVEHSGVWKTQKGDVLLEVKRGKTDDLLRAINSQGKGAHAVRRTKQTVLHLKGLDSETSKDDIEDALREAVGDKADRCRVTSLRPAFGESQNATVITDANVAQ
nr:unnamed protein product [Callosobruchus analis]